MTRTPTRRRLLHAVGVAATATLAGCSSTGDDEPTGTETTTGSGTTTGGGTTTGTTTADGTTDAGETTTETTTGDETTTNETTTGTAPPADGGDVQFVTEGGATVRGTLLGDGECGVVFAHGKGFDRKSWLPQAKRLAEDGHTCLPIDLNLDGDAAPEYVLAAVRYLRRRVGVESVLLVGAGAGASAVVRANAQAKSGTVDGTLVVSPEAGVDSAAEMQGWKLFVVSRGDEKSVQTTKRMRDAASNPKRLETVDGSAHGQRVFESSSDAMWSMMNGLLRTVCG
ncbi:hypothetical protein ZOD2009_00980 [Haladaptatus paucihalophilus DX253]|uniref:Alpha/beta hydrolase n=1 Tax=Haladaptatus paucihalophilus DX253 TaxID=797209 RepID=E7QP20_HALPU|nr:alpha/beta hydrolase [Haladaptatus paucihalophilus]EFW93673.1 hypothetical protein ZOD2009_00980 [Haladaptatus paucihalophilus DX253]SHL47405.1 hypothetical protein SAMN05444342_3896 [Haladaptatus paucihalophilus DX253]